MTAMMITVVASVHQVERTLQNLIHSERTRFGKVNFPMPTVGADRRCAGGATVVVVMLRLRSGRT